MDASYIYIQREEYVFQKSIIFISRWLCIQVLLAIGGYGSTGFQTLQNYEYVQK